MCPIVPMFTCGFVRSNFSFAIAKSLASQDCKIGLPKCAREIKQALSFRNACTAFQEPLAGSGIASSRILLLRDQFPRLKTTRPTSLLRIVLVQASSDIRSHPDVMTPRRNTPEHVHKPLQNWSR